VTGVFVIQEAAAERYRFITVGRNQVRVACIDHLSTTYNHNKPVSLLPDVLAWIGQHEHEYHAPAAPEVPAVDPACPGGPWCRCRTQHGRLKSPPCPQGPGPVSESTPTGPVG
jgi:hypothetical protein